MHRSSFTALALLLAFQAPLAAQEGVREKVARALAKTRDPIELRRSLVFLGQEAIEPLFEVWEHGRVPRSWRSDANYDLELSAALGNVIVSAFDSLPEEAVNAFFLELGSTSTDRGERIKALELVGEIGDVRSLVMLAGLATPKGANRGSISRTLRAAFGAALERTMERGEVKVEHLRELVAEVAPGLMSTVVDIMSGVPGPEAARALAALLGRRPGLDPLILNRIASRGPSANPLDEEDIRTAVRALLRSSDLVVLASAARAAGILGDERAASELVELSSHDDETVRRNVSDALQRITGLGYGSDAERWEEWYEVETAWWDEEGPGILLELETANGVEFTRAIVTALKRRLHRDRVAASLVLRLKDSDPDQVRLACAALAQLGARFAASDLLDCLAHPHPGVRETAHKALGLLTGEDLPIERDAWERALDR